LVREQQGLNDPSLLWDEADVNFPPLPTVPPLRRDLEDSRPANFVGEDLTTNADYQPENLQTIHGHINQTFKFKQMSQLMSTIPLLTQARRFWNQPDKLQLLRNRLSKRRFEHFTSLMTSQVDKIKPHLRRKIRIEKLRRRLMIHRKAPSPD
jgi:hypothetical protein